MVFNMQGIQMLSVHIILLVSICAGSTIYTSQLNLRHGDQLSLNLAERTKKLDFDSSDESEHFTIWEKKYLGLWSTTVTKGSVYSSSDGYTFRIRDITFDDEGTYTLRNQWDQVISSHTVKVKPRKEIINRVAGETLTIPLLGVKQADATLHFYNNYTVITLVENGIPVGKNDPYYFARLRVSSDRIEVLNVNVSDVGKYKLTDQKGRVVSNTTVLLVDQHEYQPNYGLIGLLALGVPGTICFCCRKRICRTKSTQTTHTVMSSSINPVPVTTPSYNAVTVPGGPDQGYIAGYPPPNEGQIYYPPPPQQWSGEPAVPPNPGFNPGYVPQNPTYPPEFGPGARPAEPPQWNAPPNQYNPPPPMDYTAAINAPLGPPHFSAPPGPEPTVIKMNELSPAAPLLMPQPNEGPAPTFSLDVLSSSDTGVQFQIDKGKSSSNNFL